MGKKKKVEEPTKKEAPTQLVTFDAWFEKAKSKYKLRDYQSYEIQVFFEKNGLSADRDNPKKYEELIKKF